MKFHRNRKVGYIFLVHVREKSTDKLIEKWESNKNGVERDDNGKPHLEIMSVMMTRLKKRIMFMKSGKYYSSLIFLEDIFLEDISGSRTRMRTSDLTYRSFGFSHVIKSNFAHHPSQQ